MFNAINSNAITSKPKNVHNTNIQNVENIIYIIFGTLWQKRWASKVICFLNYRLQKAGLLKWLQSPVSEHLRKANVLKDRKHWLNLHNQILVIFFGHPESYSARKILFWYYLKSCDSLLTYWQTVKCIVSQ